MSAHRTNFGFGIFGSAAALVSLLLSVQTAEASVHELTMQLDIRAVAVDSAHTSFTEGGLGSLRYDEDHDGLQLGRVMLDAVGPIAETFRYNVVASATDDGDQNVLDITEAFIDWRPYPRSAWRWRGRLGAFYAPISLENRVVGWQSLYSLSPSAINTWVGEEIRTLGLEIETTAVGALSERDFDVTLLAAVYGWNDPMGLLLFQRGWAVHDRQSPVFGVLPRAFVRDPDNPNMDLFQEIDGRFGYYVGTEIGWPNHSVVRLLHYDNRGDPDEANATHAAWRTVFDSIGVRVALPREITFIAQAMWGDTEFGPQGNGTGQFLLDYWSYFALASLRAERSRYTLRYDRMATETVRGQQFFDSAQDAESWTVAYLFDLNEHWQFAAEALQTSGTLAQRTLLGEPLDSTERQVQVAVRFTF